MYITKLVYVEREQFEDENFEYLESKDLIQFTDYDTTEVLADTLSYKLDEIEEDDGKEERDKVEQMLSDGLGSDVLDLLKKNELDTVMIIY